MSALTFDDAGGQDSITLPGPTNPTNAFTDPTEPYTWQVPAGSPILSDWVLDAGVVIPDNHGWRDDATSDAASDVNLRRRACRRRYPSGRCDATSEVVHPPPAQLELADAATAGLEVVVLGLVVAGPRNVVYRSADNGGPVGVLEAGSDFEIEAGSDVTLIRITLAGARMLFGNAPSAISLLRLFCRGRVRPDVVCANTRRRAGRRVDVRFDAHHRFAVGRAGRRSG